MTTRPTISRPVSATAAVQSLPRRPRVLLAFAQAIARPAIARPVLARPALARSLPAVLALVCAAPGHVADRGLEDGHGLWPALRIGAALHRRPPPLLAPLFEPLLAPLFGVDPAGDEGSEPEPEDEPEDQRDEADDAQAAAPPPFDDGEGGRW